MDTTLRGRLLSLVDKIKSLRKKEEEEKPEVEEEPKPSKINSSIIKYLKDLIGIFHMTSAHITYYRHNFITLVFTGILVSDGLTAVVVFSALKYCGNCFCLLQSKNIRLRPL